MARLTGSDDLYRLIHSLTTEEKGYFKKFAKRHTSRGTAILQMFDAINKQEVFAEKILKKKFKDYAVMKVYLKEMITDSLLLYHRHHHPHIQLLSQMQKVHLLLIKGMQDEASKIISKSIEQSKILEEFALGMYLLRTQMNMQIQSSAAADSLGKLSETYGKQMQYHSNKEVEMLEWEQISLTASRILRDTDVFNTQKVDAEIKAAKQKPASSKRSQILKLKSLYALYRTELDEKELLSSGNELIMAAKDFKTNSDSSYNDIAAVNNYLVTLTDYGKFEETLTLCDQLLKEKHFHQSYFNLIVVRCIVFKNIALIHLGKFNEALHFINSNEYDFIRAVAFTHDSVKERTFAFQKVMVLFLNKQYAEAWKAIHAVNKKLALYNFNIGYADLTMLELMTQLMMQNFDLLKNMSAKYKKEFAKHKIESFTYRVLLDFFQKASPITFREKAQIALGKLNSYYVENKKFPRKAFVLIRYTYWLEEISGGRTIRQSLEEQFGGSKKSPAAKK
jgi:hypothetical protein